jgi:hypothetical protein
MVNRIFWKFHFRRPVKDPRPPSRHSLSTSAMAKPTRQVVNDELLVLDESDLPHVMSESAVAKLKEWQSQLKEARTRDRIQKGHVLPTECTLQVSIKDLLSFGGLRSQTKDSPCVATIPVACTQGVDVIVTGCLARVKSTSWDIGAKFKEPIRIGSSLRTLWLDFSSKVASGKNSTTLEYASIRKNEPDRIMGLSGALEVGKSFQVVPPPLPSVLVLYDRTGLVKDEDILKCTATIPIQGRRPCGDPRDPLPGAIHQADHDDLL